MLHMFGCRNDPELLVSLYSLSSCSAPPQVQLDSTFHLVLFRILRDLVPAAGAIEGRLCFFLCCFYRICSSIKTYYIIITYSHYDQDFLHKHKDTRLVTHGMNKTVIKS